MLALRKLWEVLVGAWAGALAARALLDWVLGLEGTWVAVAIVGAAVVGGLVSIGAARQVQRMPASERRDAILGWGALIGGVAAVACLFLPLPWGVVAAAAVVALTVMSLQRLPPAGPQGEPADSVRR